MGIDVNGNQIVQGGGLLTINTGVVTEISSGGAVARPNNALFTATGPGTWQYPTEAAWSKLAAFTTAVIGSNCYNAATCRFTAPVDGRYAFQLTLYFLRDTATPGYYAHPSFAVNGGVGTKTASGYPHYRICFHGYSVGTYDKGNIGINYDLVAGDYVEAYVYATTGSIRYYPANSRFSGFMLG